MTAVLEVGGVAVARYETGTGMPAEWAPRPYLHPVRTLGGAVVTDVAPADHRWHHGVSVAVPDVGGSNFWGGGTYRRGEGYADRDDHGTVGHREWRERGPSTVAHTLDWLAHDGEVLLREQRRITAAGLGDHWVLALETVLHNVTGRDLALGSPGSAGRAGAGYGGIFWRLAPGARDVIGGEDQLNGAVRPWIAARSADHTLVFGAPDGDPWFVRAREYPGVGTAFAWDAPLRLPRGAAMRRSLRVAVLDGRPDPAGSTFSDAVESVCPDPPRPATITVGTREGSASCPDGR